MPKPELEKNPKIETQSNPFPNYIQKILPKKMHFGKTLVNIFSQTRKLENSTSFEPIFLYSKNSNSKNFRILKPEKLKPEPQSQRGN